MNNARILEMLNNGQIEELKSKMQDKIFEAELKKSEGTDAMKYAVYNDNALVGGVYDNDMMDWFNSYEGAEKQAQELANETGLTSYLSEVIDGDFSDEFEEIEPEE